VSDHDRDAETLTFREKGKKTITKPVPGKLAKLIEAAIAAGVYESDDDSLIPSNASQRREGNRDDRVIWRLGRRVAQRAGVTTHVHALRAAFADYYLETHPGQVDDLKQLMGHRRLETTLVYLRCRRRRRSMETVRDLDWDNIGIPQNASKLLESLALAEKEGFEPSFGVNAHGQRGGIQHGGFVPGTSAPTTAKKEGEDP
jgi:integrase